MFTGFIGNMFDNNMKYFNQVTFTTNVMRKKVCVDISLFSVFSYQACAIPSAVIKIIIENNKFQVIWCISKDIMGIYLIFGTFGKKCEVGQFPLSGALKPPVRQLRNGFSNSAQNLNSETIFKPFGLDGWLKVSYLLDYKYCYT